MRGRARLALGVALLAVGLWQVGGGLWIFAKAVVAQELLEHAWDRAREGVDRPRPWPWADVWPTARLDVPRLDLSRIVLEGTSGSALAFGPGRMAVETGSGRTGHIMLSGHRDTHFRFLADLGTGDDLVLTEADGTRYLYTVTGTAVVHVDDARLTLGDTPTLVLVTCYPFDAIRPGGLLRYLVLAERASRVAGAR
jgi:sortase A